MKSLSCEISSGSRPEHTGKTCELRKDKMSGTAAILATHPENEKMVHRLS